MRIPRIAWLFGLVYLGLSLLLVQIHAGEVNFGPRQPLRAIRHEKILEARGDAPWTYRVLMPRLAEATRPAFEPVVGRRAALETSYLWWRFVATFGFFCLFHAWLRTWLDPAWSFAGTVLAAALHPASYRNYWYQPDSPTDLLLWTAAGLLTLRGRDLWLFPLVFVGTLNREAAVFVVVLYVALRWGIDATGPLLARAAGLLACWAVPFVALRVIVGERPWAAEIERLVRDNLQPDWLAYMLAFFGALLVLPWIGWSRRPPELKRLAAGLLLTYLPLQLVFGRVREVRLFLPLLLPLVPLALLALAEQSREKT